MSFSACQCSARNLVNVCLLAVVFSLSACGGSGSSPVQVTNQITFPTDGSITGGETEISVSGKIDPVEDGDSLENHGVQVSVNGIEAQFESPSSPFWTVKVPATIGSNVISVDYIDADSSNEHLSVSVNNVPNLHKLSATAYDPVLDVMYLAGTRSRVYKFDFSSNEMTALIVPEYSETNYFTDPAAMVFDEVNRRLLLVDSWARMLFSVDVETGDVIELLDLSTVIGRSPAWYTAVDITLDAANQTAYISDVNEIHPINLRENLIEDDLDLGLEFRASDGQRLSIEYDADLHRLFVIVPYVSNPSLDRGLYAFDLQSQTTQVLSGGGYDPTTGSEFTIMESDIVPVGSNSLYVCNRNGLVEFDLGSEEILPVVEYVESYEFCDSENNFYLDSIRNRLVYKAGSELKTFDFDDMEESDLFSSDIRVSDGDVPQGIGSMTLDAENDRLLLVDTFRDIYELDLKTNTYNMLLENIEESEWRRDISYFDLRYNDGTLMFRRPEWSESLEISSVDLATGEFQSVFRWTYTHRSNVFNSDTEFPVVPFSEIFNSVGVPFSSGLPSDVEPVFFGTTYYEGTEEDGFEGHLYFDNTQIVDYLYDDKNNALLISTVHYSDNGFAGSVTALYKFDIGANELHQFQNEYFSHDEVVVVSILNDLYPDDNEVLVSRYKEQDWASFNLLSNEFSSVSVSDHLGANDSYVYLDMVFDEQKNRVWVYDANLYGMRWIDLATGDTELVSGMTKGAGPAEALSNIVIDLEKQLAYGLQGAYPSYEIFVVDLQSGSSAVHSNWNVSASN